MTALIPGTGLGGALVRNIITEGITALEDVVIGNELNVAKSLVNIGLGTVLDAKFEKVSDKVTGAINSKMPRNYSSYAYTARKSNPSLTKEQIYRGMQRSIRVNQYASKVTSNIIDIARSCLPY